MSVVLLHSNWRILTYTQFPTSTAVAFPSVMSLSTVAAPWRLTNISYSSPISESSHKNKKHQNMDYVFQIDTGTEIDFHYNKTVKRDDSRIQKWLWSYIIWRKKYCCPYIDFIFSPNQVLKIQYFKLRFSKSKFPKWIF